MIKINPHSVSQNTVILIKYLNLFLPSLWQLIHSITASSFCQELFSSFFKVFWVLIFTVFFGYSLFILTQLLPFVNSFFTFLSAFFQSWHNQDQTTYIIGTLFRLPCTTAASLRTANITTSADASVTFRTKLKASFHFVAHKSYHMS